MTNEIVENQIGFIYFYTFCIYFHYRLVAPLNILCTFDFGLYGISKHLSQP